MHSSFVVFGYSSLRSFWIYRFGLGYANYTHESLITPYYIEGMYSDNILMRGKYRRRDGGK